MKYDCDVVLKIMNLKMSGRPLSEISNITKISVTTLHRITLNPNKYSKQIINIDEINGVTPNKQDIKQDIKNNIYNATVTNVNFDIHAKIEDYDKINSALWELFEDIKEDKIRLGKASVMINALKVISDFQSRCKPIEKGSTEELKPIMINEQLWEAI